MEQAQAWTTRSVYDVTVYLVQMIPTGTTAEDGASTSTLANANTGRPVTSELACIIANSRTN